MYQNLIIFDSDFLKTNYELRRLRSGSLFLDGREVHNRRCRGIVGLREFILAEAWDLTVPKAIEKAKIEFLRNMKAFCYQILV